jgi:hypothetical protein
MRSPCRPCGRNGGGDLRAEETEETEDTEQHQHGDTKTRRRTARNISADPAQLTPSLTLSRTRSMLSVFIAAG